MAGLSIERVSVDFGAVRAVNEVSLDVAEGETVVLLGPSGCGKTTLLRLIAGFNTPVTGSVRIADRVVASPTVNVPPEKRSLSMVFQSYAVWPHKTVFENLAYGLKLRGLDKAAISAKVGAALEVVRMQDYAARYPSELSGGQQQRVALARALVLEPAILLFDEPLSNLDASLREHMRFEIKALLSKLKITSIYVTHDQNEAMVVADRIAVMNKGRIEQLAAPEDVYYNSSTDFVARFIGLANVLDARVVEMSGADVVVEAAGLGRVRGRAGTGTLAAGRNAKLYLRPEHLELAAAPPAVGNAVPGRIARRSFLGAQTDYVVDVAGAQLRVIARSQRQEPNPGDDVFVTFSPADCLVLDQ
jgi:ABC-type Fe3+/spermidine/putrescine transport system ATPase subunit